MSKLSGVYVVGVYLGSRNVPYGNDGKSRHEIGIRVAKSDGFGGGSTDDLVIRIPSGKPAPDSALVGKNIAVPVFVNTWTGKSGAGFTYFLSNHAPVVEVA